MLRFAPQVLKIRGRGHEWSTSKPSTNFFTLKTIAPGSMICEYNGSSFNHMTL